MLKIPFHHQFNTEYYQEGSRQKTGFSRKEVSEGNKKSINLSPT